MKKRNPFWRCTALFVCACVFIACAPKDTNSSKKTVEVSWWHINSSIRSHQTFQDIAADYHLLYPGVTISVTALENMEYKPKLELEFAADDPPDIFHSWGGGGLAEYVRKGYLRDITDWVLSDKWESKINPAALELFSYKGRVYGFPHDLGAVGFWYNSALLEGAGYREFPSDWDSLLSLMEALKKKGVTPVSLGIADRWPVMYYWVYLSMRIGGDDIFKDILARKRAFTDPAIITAGKLLQDFNRRGFFQSTAIGDDFHGQSRYMGDGLCAIQLMGQWALASQAQTSERTNELHSIMRFAPFPSVQGGKGSSKAAMGGANGFVIGKNAPDAAVSLLEFFTKASNLQRYFDSFPGIPTTPGVIVREKGLSMIHDYLNEIDSFCLYPDQLFPLSVGTALNETSARILLGELTPEEGAALLDDEWNSWYTRNGSD